MRRIPLGCLLSMIFLPVVSAFAQPSGKHNLSFNQLANRWDEAMPLGNGMLGALIWQKQSKLRLSLDRADLWDERKAMDISKFNFAWVEQQVLKKDYKPVQQLGDYPYDNVPYPTKLPAAAMEFDIASLGKVVSNTLDIQTALNTLKFANGVVFNCYIHATDPVGYFGFENLSAGKFADLLPKLIVHNYNNGKTNGSDNSHAGQGLEKLGYQKGTVTQTTNSIRYRQPTYDEHFYEVLVQWTKMPNNKLIGSWTVSNDKAASLPKIDSTSAEPTGWPTHITWWQQYWAQSSVSLPDAALEKQYYLELYKLGSVARAGAPAITLQAVWTADNGSLPPWKGDFHNDLNTQLSYWPAYTGNRLAEAATFTDWLWKIKPKNQQYTKHYFGVKGLNVPGVATLSGDPMGGWIQYSLSPTVGAWCAQHFYWQWKYSMDKLFLKERAYPYLHEAATYLERITRLKNGVRKLPLSSSPEYNNNDISAWFLEWSNFDLSLAKFLFAAAAEVSDAAGKKSEAKHWKAVLDQLPAYEVNETGFTVAPGQNLNESHRHFSQYMSIYPLALLDINRPADKPIIENSLRRIEKMGTRAWCGYSFAWMACLYARTYQADSALRQLQIFASNFCSPNSFHLNGDQKGGQYSGFTYRPFTLEGNFAFAQGVHELLLQSRQGYVEVFPAVPKSWDDVSFSSLRAAGGLLISATKVEGLSTTVEIKAEKGGLVRVKLPFTHYQCSDRTKPIESKDGILTFLMSAGESVTFIGR
ncbi:glycosyl hydrolase family 95 catalytic domain-containing protein [Paraflavitalea pollutisoli]|uniref:glycosyl hydrolase family 95 catalytic domain-containing protein n=1 Tax=Paraflavitalea pollutisoli TaxID=3034143 RepID=UPI0023EE19F6|nr:glycoside hydrolase N-terminal domain-containing protein [Paraflavitalea sp. H1-2-19X]